MNLRKNSNKQLGDRGEKIALEFLNRSGYKILDHNFRTPMGEIDIVAFKDELVFVEVKSRTNLKYGSPQEAVTPFKQQHIKKAALFYLQQKNMTDSIFRFDVIAILFNGASYEIEHIVSAF